MAYLTMNYRSDALGMETTLSVILPEPSPEKPARVLYLLHGLHGDHTSWCRQTAIERYAAKYRIALIMPSVARSWYADTQYGVNYFTFVAKELPTIIPRYFNCLSTKREDTFIAGLSMGGYGALKAALTCPETFGGCASLSGSLDITRRGRTCNLPEWRGNFDFSLENPLSLEGGEHDLFALTRKNRTEGREFSRLYLWCGTEDALLDVNRRYDALLSELGIARRYEESEGNHSWPWWDLHIQDAMEYLLAE